MNYFTIKRVWIVTVNYAIMKKDHCLNQINSERMVKSFFVIVVINLQVRKSEF